MRGLVRRKLEMGVRVRQFCRSHPSSDPSERMLLDELDALLTRADEAADAERNGRLEVRAAVARRREFRRAIETRLLRHVVQVGIEAAKDDPALTGKFRLQLHGSTHKTFEVSARTQLAEAKARKDEFVRRGLSEPLLDELDRSLAGFSEMGVRALASRQAHMHARAQLSEVADRLTWTVTRLDPLCQHRFQSDPAKLVVWNAARTVSASPIRRPPLPAPAETPARSEGTPPASGASPAA